MRNTPTVTDTETNDEPKKRNRMAIVNEPGRELGRKIAPPYAVHVTIKGDADLLFDRWDPDSNEAQTRKGKKVEENPEHNVYRNNDDGTIGGSMYLTQSSSGPPRFCS